MSIAVYELAVEVVLYLVAFQRRVEDGESVTYEDTRAEVLAMLNDLEQRSHQEPGLWDNLEDRERLSAERHAAWLDKQFRQ